MSQPESDPKLRTFDVTFADASNLPIHHVNALVVRTGSDEFFLTLGVVVPPDQSEMIGIVEAGHLEAQPVFRFALSRDTMEKFLAVMAGQYDEQSSSIRRLHHLNEEVSKEEGSSDE